MLVDNNVSTTTNIYVNRMAKRMKGKRNISTDMCRSWRCGNSAASVSVEEPLTGTSGDISGSHIILCYVMLCYVILYYILLYVMLYCILLCLLCYVMLYYIISYIIASASWYECTLYGSKHIIFVYHTVHIPHFLM